MKEETINQKCSVEILTILRKYKRSPSQVRYIFKTVREQGKYQVPNKGLKLPDYLTDPEIGEVLQTSLNEDSTTRLLIPLGIFTGMRISELRNLQITNIDFNNFQIKVVQGKGNKDRFIPINYEIADKIKSYIGIRKSGFVFVKCNQTPYSIRGLQKRISKLFTKINLDKRLSAHSLRHTYGTLLRRKGMKIQDIQMLMGHSKISTTEIYSKMELEPVKQEFFKLLGF